MKQVTQFTATAKSEKGFETKISFCLNYADGEKKYGVKASFIDENGNEVNGFLTSTYFTENGHTQKEKGVRFLDDSGVKCYVLIVYVHDNKRASQVFAVGASAYRDVVVFEECYKAGGQSVVLLSKDETAKGKEFSKCVEYVAEYQMFGIQVKKYCFCLTTEKVQELEAIQAQEQEKMQETRQFAKAFGAKALSGTVKQKKWAEEIRAAFLLNVELSDDAIRFISESAFAHTAKFWIETRNLGRNEIAQAMSDLVAATRAINENGLNDEQVKIRNNAMRILKIVE